MVPTYLPDACKLIKWFLQARHRGALALCLAGGPIRKAKFCSIGIWSCYNGVYQAFILLTLPLYSDPLPRFCSVVHFQSTCLLALATTALVQSWVLKISRLNRASSHSFCCTWIVDIPVKMDTLKGYFVPAMKSTKKTETPANNATPNSIEIAATPPGGSPTISSPRSSRSSRPSTIYP